MAFRLPAPADLFVGRDGELAAVSGMFAHARAALATMVVIQVAG
jgi:hypothetical protein